MAKITKARNVPGDDHGYAVAPLDGDATDSMQSQLDSLDSLHDSQASQAENQDEHFAKNRGKGGLHSAEALGKHLSKSHGPRFSGFAKSQGK